MKVSVIVPAYNSENFIAETLDCLLNQTLKDIQIIVVNDGSTDTTGAITDEYAARHSNILPIYQENAGVSAARNNGIEHAQGKYTLFLDSDDLLNSDALELMYNALEKRCADLAICRVERFGLGGNEYNPIVDSLTKESTIDCLDMRLLWNFLVSNKCYKTETLKKSGVRFPPLRYSEDGAFFMQFIHTAKPEITGVFDAVFKYRRHTREEGFSVTQSISPELVEDFSKSLAIVYDCAKKTFADSQSKIAEEYLQEIIRKKYFTLINEFYRMLWSGDDKALKFIGSQVECLMTEMTDNTKKKCAEAVKDIGTPLFSKAEISEKPFVSVIAENPTSEFIDSLYAQSMPIFEFITVENSDLPSKENIVILPVKGFKKAAKKAAKGKIKLFLKGNEKLDGRFLKVISLLKRSPKFSIFPDFCIKLGAKLLLKLKK